MCQVSQQPSRPVPTQQRLSARPKQGKAARMTVVCWESSPCVYTCLQHCFQILTEVRERGKKGTVSQIYFFTLFSRSLSTEQTESSIFFPSDSLSFFPESDESEGCILCSDGSSQQRKFPLDQTLLLIASGLLTGDPSVYVCVCVCVCGGGGAFLSEPETLTCIVGFVEQNYF